jgi:hypothetical protein
MKTVFHKIVASVILAMILKFAIDTGLYLMNQPYDMAFFLGLVLNLVAAFGVGFALRRVFSSDFTTIKDLFIHK